jgi:hypothetical protein
MAAPKTRHVWFLRWRGPSNRLQAPLDTAAMTRPSPGKDWRKASSTALGYRPRLPKTSQHPHLHLGSGQPGFVRQLLVQAAVDQVAAAGAGSVLIPAGTFDFMEKDEPWKTVTIPAAVSLFGSPTERDAKGQAKQWMAIPTLSLSPSDDA